MRSRTSVPVFRNTFHIQRLTLDTSGMEEDEFMRLISRCPGFEELTFVGNAAARSSFTWTISQASWIVFANSCPRLQCLKILDCHLSLSPPSIPVLLTLFPHMKDINIHPRTFHHSDCWKFVDFVTPVSDLSAQGHRQQPPEQRPKKSQLTRISLVGDTIRPFMVLLQLMTLPKQTYIQKKPK